MINKITGNLLTVNEGVIVHGCNAQWVMGSGIAKQIKDKWPSAFEAYRNRIDLYGEDTLGTISVVNPTRKLAIVNMITQLNYGRDPKVRYVNYAAIATGFDSLFRYMGSGYNGPINFPLIGAGLGNGDWNIIEQIINDTDPHDQFVKNLWVLE